MPIDWEDQCNRQIWYLVDAVLLCRGLDPAERDISLEAVEDILTEDQQEEFNAALAAMDNRELYGIRVGDAVNYKVPWRGYIF